MADATKTVSIIFEGQTADAQSKITELASALEKVDSAAKPAGTALDGTSTAIDRLGQTSAATKTQTDLINSGLKELGQAAGVPPAPLNEITASLSRIGAVGGAGLAAVAAAIVAVGIVAIDAADEAFTFKTQVENLTGSTTLAEEQFKFLQKVVSQIEKDFGQTANAFAGFLTQTAGASISLESVRNAFVGIVAAVTNVGGSMKVAEGVLAGFAKAARDGDIDIKELDSQITKIPNGLNIFAAAMNTSVEGLRKMAENGDLGKDAIERFTLALSQVQGNNLTPISAAFTALVNEIKAASQEVGPSGGFSTGISLIEKAIRLVTATVVTSDAGWSLFTATVKDLATSVATGDLPGFADKFKDSLQRLIDKIDPSISKLLGFKSVAESLGLTFKDIESTGSVSFTQTSAYIDRMVAESSPKIKSVDDLLKGLGVDPKKVGAGIDEIILLFADLATRPEVKGEQVLSAFEATVKRIRSQDDLSALTVQWISALGNGKISSEQFALGLSAAQAQQLALGKALGETTPKVADQSKALADAEKTALAATKAAQEYELKLIQIASNQKIKLIEAVVKLDIAQVEADAKVAVAAFASIEGSIKSTGDTLTKMLSTLAGGTQDWATWRILTQEIEKQSNIQESLVKKQIEMIDAQVEQWRARTAALERGGSLIQIDGAGLQPHLEGFMWEILRTIQVRVNSEGLEMLLGV